MEFQEFQFNPSDPHEALVSAFLDFFNGEQGQISHLIEVKNEDQFFKIINMLKIKHRNCKVYNYRLIDNEKKIIVTVQDEEEVWFDMSFDMNFETNKIMGFSAFLSNPPAIKGKRKITERELLEQFDSYLDKLHENGKFSGNVLVARHDAILLERSWGLRDEENGIPHSLETKFKLGSLNKMWTALAIGKLVETKKIRFDNTLSELFADIHPDLGKITIHHLLTHTSGISIDWNKFNQVRHTLTAIKEYQKLLNIAELKFNPGNRFEYSNMGYFTLGLVIEEVTDEGFYEFVKKSILEPANMNSSSYPVFAETTDIVKSYTYSKPDSMHEKGTDLRITDGTLTPRSNPAGSAVSTTRDLFNYSIAIKENKLLSEQTMNKIIKPHVKVSPDGSRNYGYGFSYSVFGDLISYGHNGGAPGVNSHLEIVSNGYTLIFLSNRDPISQEVQAKFRSLIQLLE